MAADSASLVWPAIGAVMVILSGVAVVWAWTLDRRRRYLLLMAGGTATYSVGLAVQLGHLPIGLPGILISAAGLLSGAILTMEAFARRAGHSLGRWYVSGILAVIVIGEIWFTVVDSDVVWRVRVEDYVTAALSIRAVVRGRLFANGRRGGPILGCALLGLAVWC